MSRRTTVADRLARGSHTVWQRRADALTAWVRAGRRDDLNGWRAALGPLLRLVLLGVLAYAVWAVVRALPWLMWLLAGWWISAAWRAGKEATRPGAETSTEPTPAHTPDDVRAATLDWIQQRIGDAQGVHLRDLLAHGQEHGMFAGLDVSAFRGHLERWGIPVRDRCRVRGLGVTVGVHRDDLVAPSGPSPAPTPEEAA